MERVYQLKVVLEGVRPQIWRRIQVPADIRLDRLHDTLQRAMGWTDSHLHSFTFGDTSYSARYEPGDLEELGMEDEREINLAEQVTTPKQEFQYTYDFGDGWQHRVVLEKVFAAVPNTDYPLCLDGKRACPPEDCGGVWGYEDLLKILANPTHPEHDWMKEWSGGDFDAEQFDLDTVNKQLRRLRV